MIDPRLFREAFERRERQRDINEAFGYRIRTATDFGHDDRSGTCVYYIGEGAGMPRSEDEV
jgi:hypothetical protein